MISIVKTAIFRYLCVSKLNQKKSLTTGWMSTRGCQHTPIECRLLDQETADTWCTRLYFAYYLMSVFYTVVHPHAVYYLYMILTVMEIEIASGGHRRRDHITPPPILASVEGREGHVFTISLAWIMYSTPKTDAETLMSIILMIYVQVQLLPSTSSPTWTLYKYKIPQLC